MAVKTFAITFQWENGNAFQMSTKEGEAATIDDIKVEENGAIGEIWSGIQSACITRINNKISSIGEEMKA